MGKNNQKFTYEHVSEFYRANGCTLLASDYINARTKMEFVCNCGDISATTFDHFKRGTRCKRCLTEKIANMFRLSQEEVENFFMEQGCFLLSEYKKHTKKVDYICSCGNQASITFNNFKKGHRCRNCGWDKMLATMHKKGTAPTSAQQLHVHSVIGGELNYPIGRCMLDMAFPEEMIYVEYDGGGHDLQAKIGIITYEEFYAKEKRRGKFLDSLGWRCVRISCPEDILPCDADIYFTIKSAKEYLLENNQVQQVFVEF